MLSLIHIFRVLFEKAGTYLNLTNQSFSFSYRRVRYSLKFDEILYLEKRGRQANIHTKKMKYQSNMNLNEIWEKQMCIRDRYK